MGRKKVERRKPIRSQTRAGLDFPIARVRNQLSVYLGGVRVSKYVAFALAAAINECMDTFVSDCKERLSEKEASKERKVIYASHCATALADRDTDYYGVFPVHVAGMYRK